MAKKAVSDAVAARLAIYAGIFDGAHILDQNGLNILTNLSNPLLLASRYALGLPAILRLNETTQTPLDGGSWLRLEFPVANDTQTILGRGYRETGAFRVAVATEIGSGLAKSNTWCEQVADIFRNQKFDGVDCRTPTTREGIDDGSYFIAAVIVPFRYEYRD